MGQLIARLWNLGTQEGHGQEETAPRRRQKKRKTASRSNMRAGRKKEKRKSVPKYKQKTQFLESSETQSVLQQERSEQENINAGLNSSLTHSNTTEEAVCADRQLGHKRNSSHHTKPRKLSNEIQKQKKYEMPVHRGRKNSKNKNHGDSPLSYLTVSEPMENTNAHVNDFESNDFKKENVVFPDFDETDFSPELFSDMKLLDITTEREDWYDISIRKYTHNQSEDIEIESINISDSEMKRFRKERRDSLFYANLITNCSRLDNLIKGNPKEYKRCQLKIESSHNATAIVLDKCSSFSKITISGRSKCGQAYNDDEVVVQVLQESRQPRGRQTSSTKDESKPENEAYGRVVGVYLSKRPRYKDVKFPVLTCTLDEFKGHLMRPLCKTVPKIHVLNETIRSQFPDEKQHLIEIKGIQNGKIKLKRLVKIDPDKRQDYVFRVVLLAWGKSEIYPRGAVVDAFIAGHDFSNGLNVLVLQHRVPRLFPRNVITEIESTLEKAGRQMVVGRKDLREQRIFTIDPPDSKDLDDALSIREEGDFSIVGVHIADVAAAVAERSFTDEEARKRAVTFYPSCRRPHPMLPEPLSHGTCSLLPGQERLAISVFFKFDKEGHLKDETVVEKTVIKSCKQFSYKDVQRIICNCDEESEEAIEKDIINLHKISSKLRYKRVENEDLSVPFEDARLQDVDDAIENPEAHSLVEEFMIITNKYIARRLSQRPKLSSLLILRTQKQPTSEHLSEWISNEGAVGHLVMKLQGQKISKNTRLSTACVEEQDDQYIIVQQSLWKKLCYCLQNDNFEEVRKIIFMDNAHPLQCLALQHWLAIMETAEYKCNDALSEENARHFGLQEERYTHFTSPIRRYVDLHVQRLVHADLDGTDVNCTIKEVIQLCQEVNSIATRQKTFAKECQALMIAHTLRSGPLIFRAYVDDVSSDKIVLHVPSLQKVSSRQQEVDYNMLKVVRQPEVILASDTKLEKVKVHVKPVVYCVRSQDRNELEKRRKYGDLSSPRILLHHDQIGVFVKQNDWGLLVNMLQNKQRLENGCRAFSSMHSAAAAKGASHVTSENSDGTSAMHPRLYEMEFSRGQIVQIQMSAKAYKGILAPQIEMVKIAQNLIICLCHSRDPVATLSRTSIKCTGRKHFTKYTEYMSAWMQLLEMEAAYQAGSSAPGIILENVNVKMNRRTYSEGKLHQSVFSGTFQLPTAFCYDRGIKFGGTSAYGIRPENDLKGTRSCPLDYLCLRFHTKCASSTVAKVKNSAAHPIIDVDYSWIGHGLIVGVSRTKGNKSERSKRAHKNDYNGYQGGDKDDLSVDFLLTHNSPEPPPELLVTNGNAVTMELLLKDEAIRRAQEILCKLKEDGCELARGIAYDKPFPRLDGDHLAFGTTMKNQDVQWQHNESLPENNPKQNKAINLALTSTLSVIQGPPGTGKTYTGIKLVYLFCKINKEMEQKGKGKRTVLYCGPSNKCVDHVAKQLKKHLGDKCPKLLRIYSSVIEDKDFPVPWKSHGVRYTNPDLKSDADLQDISLHFIIRQEGKPYAEEISKVFKKFKTDEAKTITREAIENYRKLVIRAGKEEMVHYDVLLTTCAVGGNAMCVEGAQNSVFQIIVDESAMVPEPFCLVPIVAHKAKQVVLIGDHKQLRPVIQCRAAADLGLDQSLFERLFTQYSEQSVSLNWQYRMHPEICEFPSKQFYDGHLKTCLSRLWTGPHLPFWPLHGRDGHVPHLFVDVRGQEEMLTVTTDEGNEKSKYNKKEAQKVISIFKFLTAGHGVNIKTIKILTQYNAQRSLIENKLKKLCEDQHDHHSSQISTVVSSQGGEWDYVILSTVRSLPAHKLEERPTKGWCVQNMGFITDKNQINVALTRARRGLIIVGNKELLRCDQFWGGLIDRYEKMSCVKKDEEFPPLHSRKVCH